MKLDELEKMIDAKFPKKFREIYETGGMEWLEVGYEKFSEESERYLGDPKTFLVADADCEFLFFDEIPVRLKELDELLELRKKYTGRELDGKYRVVPFGIDAGEEYYCFLYEEGGDEPKIISCSRDCYDLPEIVAEDFDEFLYIMMMSAVEYAVEEDDFSEIEGERWRSGLRFLKDEYRKIIEGTDYNKLADIYWAMNFQKAEIFS